MASKFKIKFNKTNLLLLLPWIFIIALFSFIYLGVYKPALKDLPDIKTLENPETNLASIIYSSDMKVLGKYFDENRVNVHFNDLPKHLVNALIATEDERFREHSGIDVRALSRAVWGQITFNPKGGGSTITMQLAKNLFTDDPSRGKIERVLQKVKEGIITPMLERAYTKDEIITMYLNKLDFVNNAVGINSAAKIYFNKKPIDLNLQESAMLVGMAKNPSLFNPLKFPNNAKKRRSVVLSQMLKNNFISKKTYDSINELPLGINFKKENHIEGIAPYFRQELKKTVKKVLSQRDNNGKFLISKPDGSKYDLYVDGLKIYTTIDTRFQKHAENAVTEHLGSYLQEKFNNQSKIKSSKYPPFFIGNDSKRGKISIEAAKRIINRGVRETMIYKTLTGQACSICQRPNVDSTEKGYICSYDATISPVKSKEEINEVLHTKRKVKVFDWKSPNYEKDTLLSPFEVVRYNKGILRAGLMSIDPHNGHIKAWVGGPNFKYFRYDMVKQGKRQVGSTFKPFVYATAIESGIINPCTEVPDVEYCIEVPFNKNRNKMWCPGNAGEKFTGAPMPIYYALANSMNNITASIIKKGSMINNVYSRLPQLGIDTANPNLKPVPSMALGVFDLSVFEMVSASSAFANQGVYIDPVYLIRIEDKFGNVIFESNQKVTQVWNKETAYSMLEIMKLVTKGVKHPTLKNANGRSKRAGTAQRIRYKESDSRPYAGITQQPIAGKTGTTQNNADGWFMGLTPDLVTGVWVGAEDKQVRFYNTAYGQGANTALPIFAYYTKFINADENLNVSTGDFKMPETLINSPLDCINDSKINEPTNDDGWGEDLENEVW